MTVGLGTIGTVRGFDGSEWAAIVTHLPYGPAAYHGNIVGVTIFPRFEGDFIPGVPAGQGASLQMPVSFRPSDLLANQFVPLGL